MKENTYCILVIAEGVKWLQNMKAPEGNAGLALLALQGWRLYFAKMFKPAKRSDVVFSEQNRIKTYFLFHPRSLPLDCDSEKKGELEKTDTVCKLVLTSSM